MMGRTHVITTTGTGLAGLYYLRAYELGETVPWDFTLGDILQTIIHTMNLDWSRTGLSLFLMLTLCVIALGFGALLPDIDSSTSILGRYVPFLEGLIGHRTFTHTLWVIVPLFYLSFTVKSMILWMISIGYFLHVYQDSFSLQGVEWFYPFGRGFKYYGGSARKRGFHIGIYRVGGIIEQVILGLMVVVNLWFIFKWMLIIINL